jgi:hypothetical protein
MKKFTLILSCLLLGLPALWSQGNCINVAPVGCRFSCVPVTYTGSAPDTAALFLVSFLWHIGQSKPTGPGNLCLLFPGTCTIQVVVLENGQAPDTCTAEIIVFDNRMESWKVIPRSAQEIVHRFQSCSVQEHLLLLTRWMMDLSRISILQRLPLTRLTFAHYFQQRIPYDDH